MATTLYGPQAFTAGDISWGASPAYRGSNSLVSTWTDAPITGYPEVWLMELVARVTSAGPSGENILRSTTAVDSVNSGFGIGGVGALTRGQWDMNPSVAGNFTLRWDQEFRTDYWDRVHYAQLVFLGQDFDHSEDAAVDFGSDFVFIELNQTSGYGFTWGVNLRNRVSAGAFISGSTLFANETASFSVDNSWRTLKLVVVPSTVTGSFAGDGTIGSGSVASDGSITLYSKLSNDPDSAFVQEFSETGLSFAVNRYETTAGHTTYARGITFGEATFVGGITNIYAYFDSGAIRGSWAIGEGVTVTATNAIALSVDGNTNTLSTPNLVKVFGDFEVTGTATIPGVTTFDLSTALDGLSY